MLGVIEPILPGHVTELSVFSDTRVGCFSCHANTAEINRHNKIFVLRFSN